MGKKRKSDSDEVSDESTDTINAKNVSPNHKNKKKKLKEASGWNGEGRLEAEKQDNEHENAVDARLAWTEEEMRTLVERVEVQLPKDDHLPYRKRFAKVDWEKVQCNPYSSEDCRTKFQEILSKQRTYRLLSEILQDMKRWVKNPWIDNSKVKPKKRHPDKPPQPLSSYMLFYREKMSKIQKKYPDLNLIQCTKKIGEMFHALPEDKKERYKLKALKNREEYNIKLKDFFNKHPEEAVKEKQTKKKVVEKVGPVRPVPPFKLFYESKVKKHENDPDFDPKKLLIRCKDQWKKMSDKKKSVWIKWTLEREQEYMIELAKYTAAHPDFDSSKLKQSILNKEERAVLDRVSGKPKKPPGSAYQYFCSINMTNDSYHNGMVTLKELAERWKALPEVEKQGYAEKMKKLQEKYKEEYAAYVESLPEEKKIEELQNLEKINKRTKKKPVEDKNQSVIKKWIEKKVDEFAGNLYKNEPVEPPKNVFEYFKNKLREKRPDLSQDALETKAKMKWEKLSHEKKTRYKEELEVIKNKFIKEYEHFLKNLNEKELAEYSCLKNKKLRSGETEESSSGGSSSSSDEGDDDDDSG